MRPWIVVVNYNGWLDTKRCLLSLAELAVRADIVLVDNASTVDESVEIRAEFPNVHCLRNPENTGWAGGNNTGLRYALNQGADQVILLNNDTIVSPLLVDRLLTAAARHPGFGILGPVINFMDEPNAVMTDGVRFNPPGFNGFFDRIRVSVAESSPIAPQSVEDSEAPSVTEVDIVNGCCLMVSASVVRKIGLVDEQFFLIHEESDFCLRAREAGFKCGVLGETLVWHEGSSTFKTTGKKTQRYYDARNLYLLLGKHADQHESGRGWWGSLRQYAKYVYYRYSIERENGSPEAADAVLEGVCDALLGRYGPMHRTPRLGVPVLRQALEVLRTLRPGVV